LTAVQATTLAEKKYLTFEDVVGLTLFTATQAGPLGAMAAFTSVASELLYFTSGEKLIFFNELDEAETGHFFTKATLGLAIPTTEQTHRRRNLLMLVHLASNMYGINLPRYAANISQIRYRIGGPRRPIMDDENALARLASFYNLFKALTSHAPVETLVYLARPSGELWNQVQEVANLPRSLSII
jgi:hypothetical protein